MKKRKINYLLNKRRLEILSKGFATQSEVADFIPCGRPSAQTIFREINEDIIRTGKKPLLCGIPTKNLLDYLQLTEAQIVGYAALENQKIMKPGDINEIRKNTSAN